MPFIQRSDSVWHEFTQAPWLFLARRVFAFTLSPVQIPSPSQSPTDIRLVCISDTHNTRPSLPPGDVLLHAGDLTQSGTVHELYEALAWLSTQPHPVKLFIAGNHDVALSEPGSRMYIQEYPSLTYLDSEHVRVSVRGHTLSVYGSPYTPQYGAWPFQYPRFHPSHPRHLLSSLFLDADQPAMAIWARIPPQIDVLLTHGPPLGHLDGGAGCPALLSALWRVRPRLHVFGHIHAARGVERVQWDDIQLAYEAVCVLADAKASTRIQSVAFIRLVWRIIAARLSLWWWGGRTRRAWGRETLLVNAASVGGEGGDQRDAIVVDLDLTS